MPIIDAIECSQECAPKIRSRFWEAAKRGGAVARALSLSARNQLKIHCWPSPDWMGQQKITADVRVLPAENSEDRIEQTKGRQTKGTFVHKKLEETVFLIALIISRVSYLNSIALVALKT